MFERNDEKRRDGAHERADDVWEAVGTNGCTSVAAEEPHTTSAIFIHFTCHFWFLVRISRLTMPSKKKKGGSKRKINFLACSPSGDDVVFLLRHIFCIALAVGWLRLLPGAIDVSTAYAVCIITSKLLLHFLTVSSSQSKLLELFPPFGAGPSSPFLLLAEGQKLSSRKNVLDHVSTVLGFCTFCSFRVTKYWHVLILAIRFSHSPHCSSSRKKDKMGCTSFSPTQRNTVHRWMATVSLQVGF